MGMKLCPCLVLQHQEDTSIAICVHWYIAVMFGEEVLDSVFVGSQIIEVFISKNKLLLSTFSLIPVRAGCPFNLIKSCVWINFERLKVAALVEEIVVKLKVFIVLCFLFLFIVCIITEVLFLFTSSCKHSFLTFFSNHRSSNGIHDNKLDYNGLHSLRDFSDT